jgi:L-alanine-DL-glutamate epimerase-like enolase superfamily enzyme
MLKLDYQIHDLPFEYPFELAKGLKTRQPLLLVSLGFRNLRGYGETTEIRYYNNSVQAMADQLEQQRRVIEGYSINSPERFWHFLHHLFPGNNFLISALDIAGWDLWGRMNGRSVQQLMRISGVNNPPTDYTIGFSQPEAIAQRVTEKRFPVYKLKVGGKGDLKSLEALRSATDAAIRVDANEGWTLEEAKFILPYMEKWDVELIEQPFDRADVTSLKAVRGLTSIPVIADEACRDENDLDVCLEHYDGINIKLSKCGGLTPALRMIERIKKAGKKVMLGGMCESTVGATALAQLLPLADYADIDGPLLLKENIGHGLTYDRGAIQLPPGPGLGVTF